MGLGVPQGVRAMPYLYQVVLGVTGAEGSSEEQVEPLRSPASPEELVVLLGIHVELSLGIAPGILGKTDSLLSQEGPPQVPQVLLLSTLSTPELQENSALAAPRLPGQIHAGMASATGSGAQEQGKHLTQH